MHGTAFRMLCAAAGEHFQGLRHAEQHFRHSLPSTRRRRMITVDLAFPLIRHVSDESCKQFEESLADRLWEVSERFRNRTRVERASNGAQTWVSAPPDADVMVDLAIMRLETQSAPPQILHRLHGDQEGGVARCHADGDRRQQRDTDRRRQHLDPQHGGQGDCGANQARSSSGEGRGVGHGNHVEEGHLGGDAAAPHRRPCSEAGTAATSAQPGVTLGVQPIQLLGELLSAKVQNTPPPGDFQQKYEPRRNKRRRRPSRARPSSWMDPMEVDPPLMSAEPARARETTKCKIKFAQVVDSLHFWPDELWSVPDTTVVQETPTMIVLETSRSRAFMKDGVHDSVRPNFRIYLNELTFRIRLPRPQGPRHENYGSERRAQQPTSTRARRAWAKQAPRRAPAPGCGLRGAAEAEVLEWSGHEGSASAATVLCLANANSASSRLLGSTPSLTAGGSSGDDASAKALRSHSQHGR